MKAMHWFLYIFVCKMGKTYKEARVAEEEEFLFCYHEALDTAPLRQATPLPEAGEDDPPFCMSLLSLLDKPSTARTAAEFLTRTLEGFRSRWITCSECNCETPASSCFASSLGRSAEIRSLLTNA